MAEKFDVVVIGSGPGGYVCAIRASQLGLKTAIVEKRKTHGGTCLNVGCIPSKALLHTSELFDEAGHKFGTFGIDVGKPKLNLDAMMAHKQDTIDGNVQGIAYLLKKNKITTVHGTGRIAGSGKVEIAVEDGDDVTLDAKSVVIATGSDVASLPGIEIDEDKVVSSTGALEFSDVPDRLIVVGAGVIGLELGSVWRRLGAKVLVVEYLDRILPGMDLETSQAFQKTLKKQGIDFKLSAKVTAVEKSSKGLKVTVEPAQGGDEEVFAGDVVLVAIGRSPYTEGLGLEEVGVKLDNHGRVITGDHFETNVEGIYAIGDVIAGPMLAHKAEDEGVALAEHLAGLPGHVNYEVIPSVVYTSPEIAALGKTEEELKEAGVAYKAGKFPFTANGRAKAMGHSDGFIKILADEKTDRVLGVHMMGAGVGEMIHEAAVLMEFGGSSEDLARTCHAHPTLSEAVKEAALAVDKRTIHM